MERLTILPFPRGVRNKGLTTQKTFIQRAFAQFQDTELKLHRYVTDSPGQVRGLKILPYPQRGQE